MPAALGGGTGGCDERPGGVKGGRGGGKRGRLPGGRALAGRVGRKRRPQRPGEHTHHLVEHVGALGEAEGEGCTLDEAHPRHVERQVLAAVGMDRHRVEAIRQVQAEHVIVEATHPAQTLQALHAAHQVAQVLVRRPQVDDQAELARAPRFGGQERARHELRTRRLLQRPRVETALQLLHQERPRLRRLVRAAHAPVEGVGWTALVPHQGEAVSQPVLHLRRSARVHPSRQAAGYAVVQELGLVSRDDDPSNGSGTLCKMQVPCPLPSRRQRLAWR